MFFKGSRSSPIGRSSYSDIFLDKSIKTISQSHVGVENKLDDILSQDKEKKNITW